MLTSHPASRTWWSPRFETPCSAASLPHVPSFGAKHLLTREGFRAENLKSSVPLKKNLRDEVSLNEVRHGRGFARKGMQWDVAAPGGSVHTCLGRGGKRTQGNAEIPDSGPPCPNQLCGSQRAP